MNTIKVRTETTEYPVVIGDGAASRIRDFLKQEYPGLTKLLIMTDSNVGPLYLSLLFEYLEDYNPIVFTAPGGEKAKTIETYYDGVSCLLENGLDRKSMIIALGGGAVGDLAGFVAATYMRGIDFIQVPTTILAHDSSVGGKTGINHPLGKNMIGAFHHPVAVFYDLSFLETLPGNELRSGFAEAVKHALIGDRELLGWLLANVRDLSRISISDYEAILSKGINVKAVIVSTDEKEKGVRAYLNFGHTLGHAIEAEMGYGKITHGEAVMIGMLFALGLSKNQGFMFDYSGFLNWVSGLGYLTRIPEGLTVDGLAKRMKQDKKTVGGTVRFVLLRNIGEPYMQDIADETLKQELKKFF